MSNISIADINRAGFSLPAVGSYYSRQRKSLDRDELAALAWILQYHGRVTDLLDLGVGAGRTVEPLRQSLTDRYVGLDFSPAMIEICRKRYPDADFRVGDARDLSMFRDRSFDVVFFSFNGIDYVDHDGRSAIFAEARRVLRHDGFFVFSAHNRAAQPESLWWTPGAPIAKQVLRLGWSLLHLPWIAVANIRHLSFRRFEIRTDEYEIRNDTAHGYRMMTYYIDAEKQTEQLTRAGFHNIRIFDTTGHQLDLGETSKSAWLCYLCRSCT